MKNTRYTVLMSVYIKEKAEYLKLSIQSMLDQTVPPDEFILVKDGPSLQKSEEIHHSIQSINTLINPSSNPSSHPP